MDSCLRSTAPCYCSQKLHTTLYPTPSTDPHCDTHVSQSVACHTHPSSTTPWTFRIPNSCLIISEVPASTRPHSTRLQVLPLLHPAQYTNHTRNPVAVGGRFNSTVSHYTHTQHPLTRKHWTPVQSNQPPNPAQSACLAIETHRYRCYGNKIYIPRA